jgi:hypothetical protein
VSPGARAVPASVRPADGIGGLASTDDVKPTLARLLPCWGIFKLSRAIHALRLWGPDAVFDVDRYRTPYAARVYTGRELLSLFLDHRHFARVVSSAPPILTATDHGVIVESNSGSIRMEGDLAHIDKLLRVCGELGISRDTFMRTSNGESTVGDMVRGSIAMFDPGQELEWTVEGLGRYLAPTVGWSNRFGEPYTFDQAVGRLTSRAKGTGSCFGTHTPYALAILLRLDDEYKFLKRSSRADIVRYLQDVSRLLEDCQTSNGNWRFRWAPAVPSLVEDSDEYRTVAGLTVMGHHMEWIAFAPPKARPGPRCVKMALNFLIENTPQLSDSAVHQYYHQLSHIGRALCHYAGVEPTSAYKLFV